MFVQGFCCSNREQELCNSAQTVSWGPLLPVLALSYIYLVLA
jgi:hypothetical protein